MTATQKSSPGEALSGISLQQNFLSSLTGNCIIHFSSHSTAFSGSFFKLESYFTAAHKYIDFIFSVLQMLLRDRLECLLSMPAVFLFLSFSMIMVHLSYKSFEIYI